MAGLLATRWVRPAPALVTAWVLQNAAVPVASVDWSDPQPMAAVIGPPGPKGGTGDTSGTVDPGDLTLYFENGLT